MNNAAYFKNLNAEARRTCFDKIRNTKAYKKLMFELNGILTARAKNRHNFCASIDLACTNIWLFDYSDFRCAFEDELITRGFIVEFEDTYRVVIYW